MNLNCIITDDEPIAQEIIEDYVKMIPGLTTVAKCKNAMETMDALRQNKVDILFMDIHMPGISGLDFIRSLKERPSIIFTTAYPNYAIDAFDLDVADYLLKPVSIDRFLRAVNKVYNKGEKSTEIRTTSTEKTFFFIKSNSDLVKVEYDSILYVEGLENYVKIYCDNKAIVSFSTMKNIEDILSPHRFLRIHRSYIVNLNRTSSIQNNSVNVGNDALPIGKSYRKAVAEVVKAYYSI